MAATFGTLVFEGNGRLWNIDCSIPDAVNTQVTFSGTGLSSTTSPTTWRAPCNGVIRDLWVATAPTAVGGTVTLNNQTIQGSIYRYINQGIAVIKRQPWAIPVKAGDLVGIVQW